MIFSVVIKILFSTNVLYMLWVLYTWCCMWNVNAVSVNVKACPSCLAFDPLFEKTWPNFFFFFFFYMVEIYFSMCGFQILYCVLFSWNYFSPSCFIDPALCFGFNIFTQMTMIFAVVLSPRGQDFEVIKFKKIIFG